MGATISNFDYEANLFADRVSQSSISKETEEKNGGAPRRANAAIDKLVDCAKKDGKELRTLWETFQFSSETYKTNVLYGTMVYKEDGGRGEYVWETYGEIAEAVKEFGSGLAALGQKRKANVGIYSMNRTEWMIASLANFSRSIRTVALYDTLGSEAILHILSHAELEVIVCSKDKVEKILDAKRASKEALHLKTIIQFDENKLYNNTHEGVSPDELKLAKDLDIDILSFSEVKAMGKEKPVEYDNPDPDDLAFIMYTSGTTGIPKGAMLHHQGIIACVGSTEYDVPVQKNDVHVSYLPLAHIFETVVQVKMILNGGSIGFFGGDIKKISEDFVKLQPTVFCGVPRVFNKMYSKVLANVEAGWFYKRWLFSYAFSSSSALIRTGERSAFYDKMIWTKISTIMGLNRVRLIITGAAPCPPYLLEFMKIVCNASIVQGYGMTETSAAVSVSLQNDCTVGHNGPPLSCCEVKLDDILDMNYLSSDDPPRGEIMVRGVNIFKGYYKNDDATNEAITKDGWLHTGDVGRWNPNGTLSIIDRKKNIFKLSQGEYIAAEKIEDTYTRAESVNQVYIYGNSYKSFVVGVVVPDAAWVVKHLKHQELWTSEYPPFSLTPEFIAAFSRFMKNQKHYDACKELVFSNMKLFENDLKGFEKVRDIVLEYEFDDLLQGFNVGNDCMTPSFKLRRPFLTTRYLKSIQDLYKANGEAPKHDEKWGAQ